MRGAVSGAWWCVDVGGKVWLPRSWGNSWVDGDSVIETAGGRLDWGKSNGQSYGHV